MARSARYEAIARKLVQALANRGARAVAIVGSQVSGDATERSDLDLAVIGNGPHSVLELHDGVVVSLGWASPEVQRARLSEPAYLGTHVPGWRSAVVLHDPEGLAASIQREAVDWDWVSVEARCDTWVADTVTDYAEEVLKLVAALDRGDRTTAAVQRSVLALRLARPLALHRRILYSTENALWGLVATELGPSWADAQAAALGLDDRSFEEECRASLRLYELAVAEVEPLLDERQQAVVTHVLAGITAVGEPDVT